MKRNIEAWELERAYERAKCVFGSLISSRSEWINNELNKIVPDTKKIAQWEEEQGNFMYQRDNIFSLEKPELEALINKNWSC